MQPDADRQEQASWLARALATAISQGDTETVRTLVTEHHTTAQNAATAALASPTDPAAVQQLRAAIGHLADLWLCASRQLGIATTDGMLVAAIRDLLGDQTPNARLEPGELRQRLFRVLETTDRTTLPETGSGL